MSLSDEKSEEDRMLREGISLLEDAMPKESQRLVMIRPDERLCEGCDNVPWWVRENGGVTRHCGCEEAVDE